MKLRKGQSSKRKEDSSKWRKITFSLSTAPNETCQKKSQFILGGWGREVWAGAHTPFSQTPRGDWGRGVRAVCYTPSPRHREKIGGEGKGGSPHPLRRDAGRGLEEGECQSQGVNL